MAGIGAVFLPWRAEAELSTRAAEEFLEDAAVGLTEIEFAPTEVIVWVGKELQFPETYKWDGFMVDFGRIPDSPVRILCRNNITGEASCVTYQNATTELYAR